MKLQKFCRRSAVQPTVLFYGADDVEEQSMQALSMLLTQLNKLTALADIDRDKTLPTKKELVSVPPSIARKLTGWVL